MVLFWLFTVHSQISVIGGDPGTSVRGDHPSVSAKRSQRNKNSRIEIGWDPQTLGGRDPLCIRAKGHSKIKMSGKKLAE